MTSVAIIGSSLGQLTAGTKTYAAPYVGNDNCDWDSCCAGYSDCCNSTRLAPVIAVGVVAVVVAVVCIAKDSGRHGHTHI